MFKIVIHQVYFKAFKSGINIKLCHKRHHILIQMLTLIGAAEILHFHYHAQLKPLKKEEKTKQNLNIEICPGE